MFHAYFQLVIIQEHGATDLAWEIRSRQQWKLQRMYLVPESEDEVPLGRRW
jgi:hypothetical protein